MKKLALIISALLLSSCAILRDLDIRYYNAHMTGAYETPPVKTIANGDFTLNSRGSYTLRANDVLGINHIITASHLHCGKVGKAGPVVYTLYSGGNSSLKVENLNLSGTIDDSKFTPNAQTTECPIKIDSLDKLEDAIRLGYVYVNVHTNLYPAGEIRGQVERGSLIQNLGPENGQGSTGSHR